MKVGDLVVLSAYGHRLKCNYEFSDSVGLVVFVDDKHFRPVERSTVVNVLWTGYIKPVYQIRADLKFAK